jgi:ketosteroid isomerase-like protein
MVNPFRRRPRDRMIESSSTGFSLWTQSNPMGGAKRRIIVRFQANTVTRLVTALSFLALFGFIDRASESTAVTDIDTVLDDFSRAATNADFDGYFACLAPDAVFIGTDATERWSVDELRAFVKPHFDQGRGRAHTPRDRHVDLCPGGNVAYFDELVEIESLGVCRGTGVVIKLDDTWLILQYSLSFPVPNEIALDVVDRIRTYHEEPDEAAAENDAGIRESLATYLAAASLPEPKPIDPELFAADIEALWSNGETYRGRESVVKALEESQRELEATFDSFGAKAERVRVHSRGDVAWVMCRIKMNGTRTEGGAPFARTVRSTFVFQRKGDHWQMTHEHSSPVAEDQQR